MAEVANLLAEFVSRLNLSGDIVQTFAEGGRIAMIRRGESVVKRTSFADRTFISLLHGG